MSTHTTRTAHLMDFPGDHPRVGRSYFTLCGKVQSHAGDIVHSGRYNVWAPPTATPDPRHPLCPNCRERLEKVVDLDAEPETTLTVTITLSDESMARFRRTLYEFGAQIETWTEGRQ